MVPTWRSCGLLAGDSASYGATILQNADEHITRFIDAWRFANAPPPEPGSVGLPELSAAIDSGSLGKSEGKWRAGGEPAAPVYLHKIRGGGGSADPAHAHILVLVSRLPRLLNHSGIVFSERKIVLPPGGDADRVTEKTGPRAAPGAQPEGCGQITFTAYHRSTSLVVAK